jgi:tetratricopeptide (TPR) repeat protein
MSEKHGKEEKVLRSFASRVDRNDPGALNNLGVLYFRKGMYEEAIAQFKEALKLDSRFDLARENLQYLFTETDMEDPDVSRWKKEVEEFPDNVEAILGLGVSYQNMGKLQDALNVLGEVVERKPDNFLARLHLGSVLKAQGLYQQALEHYQYVSDDVAKSTVFHTDLGEIYYNLGRTEEAISELRTAIKLDADYWRSHFLLSFAYGDVGHLQDALEESRIASRLNPSFQNTEANLALADYGAESQDMMGSGVGKDVPSLESTSYTLGTAYRERGYLKEALKEFQKALNEMPDKDRVYTEIGNVCLVDGKKDRALISFLRALEVNPENAEAYRLLGSVHHLREEFFEAAACYLQSFRLNSVSPDTINNLGVLLYQVGLVEDAERMFKKGLNLKLYHQELNYNFLNCNMIKEEYMMAENLIQRLEAFMGKSTNLYEKRALLNYKLNRMTLALFDIESALSIDRRQSNVIYLKGLIFLREEDFQGAIQEILAAAKIDRVYTGMYFSLVLDSHAKTVSAKVNPSLPVEPSDDLIELLEAGINRRFDKIRSSLMSIVTEGNKKAHDNEINEDCGSDDRGGGDAGVDGGEDIQESLEEIKLEI